MVGIDTLKDILEFEKKIAYLDKLFGTNHNKTQEIERLIMAALEDDKDFGVATQRKTIKELIEESHRCAVEHGWWEGDIPSNPRNFPEQLALMHSELSEVLEEYRTYGLNTEKFIYNKEEKPDKPEGIAVEFADLLIRVFDTCARYRIPLEQALEKKMAYNETRPYRHGGKLA